MANTKHSESVIKGLATMHHTKAYSDLVIKCGTRTFDVHKAIVCPQSAWFEAACKPDAFKEGQQGIVELPAASDDSQDGEDVTLDDPDAVQRMVDFFYFGGYEASSIAPTTNLADCDQAPENRPLTMHAKVFTLAVKYQIEALRDFASTNVAELLETSVTGSDLASALSVIFLSTPDEERALRDPVIDNIVIRDSRYLELSTVEAAIKVIPGLCYDLLTRARRENYLMKDQLSGAVCGFCRRESFRCTSCKEVTSQCGCVGTSVGKRSTCRKCGMQLSAVGSPEAFKIRSMLR